MSTHFLFLRSLKKRIRKAYTSTDDPWSNRLPQTHKRWKCFLCPVLLTQQSNFSYVGNGACDVWEVQQEQGRVCPAPSWWWEVPPGSPTGSSGSWCSVLDFCSMMKELWKILHLLEWLLRLHREVADSANSSMKWLPFANARILKDNYIDVIYLYLPPCNSLPMFMCVLCVLFLHDLGGGQDSILVWLI